MKRIAFHTLGCKVNYCDTDSIRRQFTGTGEYIVSDSDNADICIINTCTVTDKSDAKCRQAVRKAIKNAPGAVIIVTGCLAETQPDVIKKIPGVDYVIGNPDKDKILDIFKESKIQNSRFPENRPPGASGISTTDHIKSRTRAFLKIQDGCSFRCSYCIIPDARGESRSVPVNDVINNVIELKDSGFREIVLTGINLGDYNNQNTKLTDLLGEILEIGNIPRIRLSSVEPDLITDDLVDLAASRKEICPHFHVPLQSGDDGILKSMKRHYTGREFKEVIKMIKTKIPDAGLGTDIIAGFPGESEEAFSNSYNLIDSLPFTYLHVFPFSVRKGTPAADMDVKLSSLVIKDRAKKLKALGKKKQLSFLKSRIGKNTEVLVETQKAGSSGESIYVGTSVEYIRCEIVDTCELNSIVPVKISRLKDNRAIGNILK